MQNREITPVLKWAGGKRKLLKYILPKVPKEYNAFYEPFLGGAAVLLGLQPNKAIVNDLNKELINVYKTIKENPNGLIELLEEHKKNHSDNYYYQIRNVDRLGSFEQMSEVEKAARIIYLNHTCYNGLYRVNKNGYYNTPLGRYKNPMIYNVKNINAISEYFNSANIDFRVGDYKEILFEAKQGDFVYLDPPYDPLTPTSSFTMYTSSGFTKDDQINLKEMCDLLNEKGIKFLQSNSDTPFIRELYKEYKIEVIEVSRMINSKSSGRVNIQEVLISNY